MTNQQKAYVRWAIRNSDRSDQTIAADAGCTKQTVKNYRKAITNRKETENAQPQN